MANIPDVSPAVERTELPQAPKRATTDSLRKHEKFYSKFLPAGRTIIVYLPPCYETRPDLRYPVLYLQDGQNLFDASTAFGGNEWRADETAGELITAREIEPLIIVG